MSMQPKPIASAQASPIGQSTKASNQWDYVLACLNRWVRPISSPSTLLVLAPEDDLDQVISALPQQGGRARCQVILPNAWIEWASIPWLGPHLRPEERAAVQVQRLSGLFGPSADRRIAAGRVRFGSGQWIAATSQSRVERLQELLASKGFHRVRLVPAHAAAWNAYARGVGRLPTFPWHTQTASPLRGAYRDHLFATLDGDTLTVSWKRYALAPADSSKTRALPVIGIRSMALGSAELDEGQSTQELIRSLRREILLQRLSDPYITLVVHRAEGATDAAVSFIQKTKGVYPPDWEVFQTADWQSLVTEKLPGLSKGKNSPTKPTRRGFQVATLSEFDLDFSKPSAQEPIRPTWGRWALGFALLCAIVTGLLYQQQSQALVQMQDALEQSTSEQVVRTNKPPQQTEQSALERAQRAQLLQVRASLDVPWESLFQCVESSVSADVTLSQIQPDPHGGELVLAGDAKSYKAIGALVTKLEENASASNADSTKPSPHGKEKPVQGIAAPCREIRLPYLSSFQINEQDPQRTLHFEIHASWMKRRSAGLDASTSDASVKEAARLGVTP